MSSPDTIYQYDADTVAEAPDRGERDSYTIPWTEFRASMRRLYSDAEIGFPTEMDVDVFSASIGLMVSEPRIADFSKFAGFSMLSSPDVTGMWRKLQAMAGEMQQLQAQLRAVQSAAESYAIHAAADRLAVVAEMAEAAPMSAEQAKIAVGDLYRTAGRNLYPSDVAAELGLDYEDVLVAIAALEAEGLISPR